MKRSTYKIITVCLLAAACLLPVKTATAEVIERIVAVVNDDAVLLTEFKEVLRRAEESGETINRRDVIDGMINEILLLEQARRFSLGREDIDPGDKAEIIRNYINKRIKALIYIPFREIESYYFNNLEKYAGRDFSDLKDEIEEYLLGRTLKIKVQEHIDELRENARIRIQLD